MVTPYLPFKSGFFSADLHMISLSSNTLRCVRRPARQDAVGRPQEAKVHAPATLRSAI